MSHKFQDFVNIDAYWMGIAFFLASKHSTKRFVIAIESGKTIQFAHPEIIASSKNFEHESCPIVDLIEKCRDKINTVIYCTFTPDYQSLLCLSQAKFEKIIYFKDANLCEDSQDLISSCTNFFISPFNENLNWMKDYISILDNYGIFA